MWCHDEAKLCFLGTPRTANRATSFALEDQVGFKLLRPRHEMPIEPFDDEWIVFAAHRNPYDLLVSWWHFRKRPVDFGMPFIEYMWRRWEIYFPDPRSCFGLVRPHVNRWIRYENKDEDVNAILVERGLPRVKIPIVGDDNAQRFGTSYQLFYSRIFRHTVQERFARDFHEFGYAWEELGSNAV